jgi:hypothetical protein
MQDSSFTYNYSLYVLGKGVIKGTWDKNFDTIKLYPKPRFSKNVSSIKIIEQSEATYNKINLFKTTFFNDTLELTWLYKFDNDINFTETDSLGHIELKKKGVVKLAVKDWMHSQGYDWINIIDSSFVLTLSGSSVVNIYIADSEPDPLLEIIDKILIKRKNRLYQANFNKNSYYFKQ